MRSKILVVVLMICFTSQSVLAGGAKFGVVIGAVVTTIGGVSLLASGIVAGVASNEKYCDGNSRFNREGVIGHHDCSYQVCAVAQYQGDTYYCQTYGTYDGTGYQQSCQYSTGGYSSCIVWYTVPQSCEDMGCIDPNTQEKAEYLRRKIQPTYRNSLYAVYASAGVLGAGLITLITSLCLKSNARSAINDPQS